MATLNLNNYITKRKLVVVPESLFKLLYVYHKIPARMVYKEAKRKILEPEDCYFCKNLRKKRSLATAGKIRPQDVLCRKHRGIYDFMRTHNKVAYITLDREYYLYTEYALTKMPTDPNGYYMIHLPLPRKTDFETFFVFALAKKYFEDMNLRTSLDDIFEYDVVTLTIGTQLYALNKVEHGDDIIYEFQKL